MTGKEPTSIGELWRLMDLKIDGLVKELSMKADKAVFDLTVKSLQEDIDSIRATAKWAIGIGVTLFIALAGLITGLGVV